VNLPLNANELAMKILIVDDDKQSLYMLEKLLRGSGYEIESASDGVEALEKLSEARFDMVICDILMPRMDGFQLCHKIKTDKRLKHIAFIFYTAVYTDQKDENFALSLGAEKFIIKPQKPDVFIRLLREVIESYESGTLASPRYNRWKRRRLSSYLREYNERLVKGLEHEMLQLETAKKTFEEQVALLSKKNRYEAIISTVTRSVHQSINLQELMETAVEAMSKNIEGVDHIGIYLVEGEEAVIRAYRGLTDRYIKLAGRIPYPKGVTWKTIIEGKSSYIPEVDKDTTMGPAGREMGIKSCLSMPIHSEGKTVGCVNITSLEKNAFDEEELKLLEVVAQQIEIGIDNARRIEALRQSEERYRTLFDQSPVGVYIFDRDLRITQCNERMAKILKSSYDKIIGLDLRKLKDQGFVPAAEKAIEGYPSYHEGFYEATTSPTKLWLSQRFSPLRDTNGNVIGGMGVVEDVSRRKLAEQKLIASEVRYRRLFESAQDGILILDADTGQITDVNPFLIGLLGYSRDELLGKTLWEIGLFQDVEISQRAFQELQREEYVRYDNLPLETKYGKRIIEVELISNIYLVNDKKVIQCNIRDVTERKQSEEKIREQAQLLDKAQDAIFVRDLEHRIIYWNRSAERLYGWTADEAIGKNANEILYRKEDLPQIIGVQRNVIEEGEWVGELNQIAKDGKEIIVASSWTLVKDSDGKPKSILVVNTDITEKKRLEAQFLRAQRMESIGTLAGGIAHDLNNVLQPIMMSLQLLRSKLTDEQSQKWINTLETSAERGANLVKQVLSFARGAEGERTVIQVRYMISEFERIIKETFPKSIEIRTDIPKDLWTISGEPTQLHQVLMNLCVNARDAMPYGGTLSISAENLFVDENHARMDIDARVGPYIIITVSDTGIGIPAEIIDRIFEPFFTTKGLEKGTGLGLSTVFGIVKGYGGFIHVYSEVGKGTTFKVYLPAIETTEAQKVRAKRGDLPLGHGELILVVDDEVAILEIARETLESYGYKVITAGDGAEAVALHAEYKEEIRAVILDMVMPLMDGPACIRALREIEPQVRIIAVSGLMEKERIDELRNIDVQAFLSKPYTAETLLRTLHEVLRK